MGGGVQDGRRLAECGAELKATSAGLTVEMEPSYG